MVINCGLIYVTHNTTTGGVEVMATKVGVNPATPNPLHHHLYLPPAPTAAVMSCAVLDSAWRSELVFPAGHPELRTCPVCISAQLATYWLLIRFGLLHHAGDLGRLKSSTVRPVCVVGWRPRALQLAGRTARDPPVGEVGLELHINIYVLFVCCTPVHSLS